MESVSLPIGYSFLGIHATGSHGLIIHALGPGGVPCAVKASNPEQHFPQALFRREVEIQSSLRIPGVVPVLDRWTGDSGEVMAMPWLPNKLSDRAPLGFPLAVEILLQGAKTLERLHARGVVHRDISPENILFSSPDSPDPWLGDFGLAVRVGETEIPEVGPTPGYGFPKPAKPWDARQDTYGLVASVWSVMAGGGAPSGRCSWKSLRRQSCQAGHPVPARLARQFSRWLNTPPDSSTLAREAAQLARGSHTSSSNSGMLGLVFSWFFSWFRAKPSSLETRQT